LREKGPEVVGFFLVLDPGEYHLGAGNLRLRVLDVVLELGLVQVMPEFLLASEYKNRADERWRLGQLLEKIEKRGRLIFALDATMSRLA
jgi:hypothetical protein